MAGTTNDKLNRLNQTKEAFRTAITGKGQTISDDEPYSAWPAKVSAIETGVTLPTLTNPGGAADLRKGKQLIDQAGQIVDGTLEEVQQATPIISVSSSGLITATAGDKSATHQLSSSDSSAFSESNIKKGVSLFGKTGTMQPVNTAIFDSYTVGNGYIEFSNTDFFGSVNSPSTLVIKNAWCVIIIGTRFESFSDGYIFTANDLSVTGTGGWCNLYPLNDGFFDVEDFSATLSFTGGAIKLRLESDQAFSDLTTTTNAKHVYSVRGAFAYTC